MSDNEVKVAVTAQTDQLTKGMQDGVSQVTAATDQLKSSVSDLNSHISSQITQAADTFTSKMESMASIGASFGAMIAGYFSISALKSSIDGVTSLANEIKSLQRVTGESAEDASVLNVALKMIGSDSDTYTSAVMKLNMHLKTGEGALNQLGVATRDSNHNLLDQTEIMNNALSAMAEYKEGTDRNQFAMYAFGKGAAEVQKLTLLNNDTMARAKQVAQDYGLIMTGQAVTGARSFSIEMKVLNLALEGMKVQIGQALMPAVMGLAGYFQSVMPVAITVVVVAVKSIVTAFELLTLAIKQIINIIITTFAASWTIVATTIKAVVQTINGDFTGAWNTIKGGIKEAGNDVKIGFEQIAADGEKAAKRVQAMWAGTPLGPTGDPSLGKGTKSFKAPEKEKKSSRVPEWKDELEQQMMDQKAYYGFMTEDDRKFWQQKLALTKDGTKEQFEVNHILFELDRQDQEDADQKVEKDARTKQKAAETEMKASELSIKVKEKEVDAKYKLGQISTTDQIKQTQDLENQRYAQEMAGYQKILNIWENESEEYQQTLNKMQLAKEQHDAAIQESDLKLQLETKSTWDKILQPIQNAIQTSVQGMILGTTTLSQAIKNLGQSVIASFISMCTDMAKKWLETKAYELFVHTTTETQKTAATTTGTATRETEEAAAAAEADTVTAVSNTTRALSNTAVAATGAAAAEANIPYVGPALAIAAAAAMLGAMAPYVAMASASGGWDVDQDMLTQVHKKEMILPAHLAENVRNMTGQGTSSNSGGGDHFHIHAWDNVNMQDFLNRHGRKLGNAVRNEIRNNSFRRAVRV